MGRNRSWVVRITTAECAVELRCSAGGFCSVVLQCGFAVGCEDSEDTGFCPLRIMGCAPEQYKSQEMPILRAFLALSMSGDNQMTILFYFWIVFS